MRLKIQPPNDSRTRPGVRWWPAVVILLAALAALFWIWRGEGRQRQDHNLQSGIIVVSTLALLLGWCLAFSRLPWRRRLGILSGVLGVIALGAALFRYRGVTGDLLPVFEWRWRAQPARMADIPAPTNQPPSGSLPTRRESGGDYPQFLGPERNVTVAGLPLARDWRAQPPVQLWRRPVGTAWSGFAVAGPYAVTQEQSGDEELVSAYEVMTGKPLWSHADAAHYRNPLAGEGPRATPTITGGRVFTLGGTGLLNCLDLATGRCLWSKNIIQDNQATVAEWGMSGSPLVFSNLVVVCPGGPDGHSLVAYRADTGERMWSAGSDHAGYSSPCLTRLLGSPQILIFNQAGLVAHTPHTGAILWRYPWPGGHPHVAMPVVLPGDRVLVSSGYGTGSESLHVARDSTGRWSATRLWKSHALKAKFTNVVYRDGCIYGLDDGTLVCLRAATGERQWKGARYGHGQVILTGDLLLVMAESGEVVLLNPDASAPRELSRFTALAGKTWNPPALAGPLLLVRNDKEGACFRLPTRGR